MATLQGEISRRRTFAIISHPDAGKTTLTEKLLLFGGAIHIAGAVKSNKIKKTATSDWMEIEKQRGISVATSVMGFNYGDYKINILDTPGHQDFAEDTYRTLTAVDSVIIVVDVAKGVETQTRKLMEVCRMRNTPVIIFVNKLDREGRDPFEILDELEAELKIAVRPLSWPINIGAKFKGVYNIYEHAIDLFTPDKQKATERVEIDNVDDPRIDAAVGEQDARQLRDDLELIEGVYPDFDVDQYLAGKLAPVFFGSALNTFGVKELLDCFVKIAPSPRPIEALERTVKPEEEHFSGFVFKIHANMDPNHRSCIAFVKVCSGRFERNAPYKQIRTGKTLRFAAPTAFMYIENADPMKAKQLEKGIQQLMDEGVAQLFIHQFNGRKVIGTVGQLQFEVIQYRLLHEYGAQCRWEPMSMYKACWIESDDADALEAFKKRKHQFMAVDREGRDVFLADSQFVLTMAQNDFPKIRFSFSSEKGF